LNNFDWVEPKNVKKEINELIDYYNKNIDNAEDKFYFIIYFLINFLRIHPFGN
jgi:Fic family protein